MTACNSLVFTEWPKPLNDDLAFVDNPVESGFPGHWLPVSLIKRIMETRVRTTIVHPFDMYNKLSPKIVSSKVLLSLLKKTTARNIIPLKATVKLLKTETVKEDIVPELVFSTPEELSTLSRTHDLVTQGGIKDLSGKTTINSLDVLSTLDAELNTIKTSSFDVGPSQPTMDNYSYTLITTETPSATLPALSSTIVETIAKTTAVESTIIVTESTTMPNEPTTSTVRSTISTTDATTSTMQAINTATQSTTSTSESAISMTEVTTETPSITSTIESPETSPVELITTSTTTSTTTTTETGNPFY